MIKKMTNKKLKTITPSFSILHFLMLELIRLAMIRKENKLEKNENEIEKDKNTILLQPQDIFSYHGSSCQELLIT